MTNIKSFCCSMRQKVKPSNDNKKEWIWIYGSGGVFLLFISLLFFRTAKAVIFLSPYLFLWNQKQRRRQDLKKQEKIRQESRECLQLLMNGLSVGYSIERSICEIQKEMQLLYPKGSYLIPKLQRMERKLQMNQPVEQVFYEFAVSTKEEDLIQFAFILQTAKKRGGNLIQILEKTIHTIGRKHQVEEEIKTMLTGRVFEKNIMKVVPMGLIGYLQIFNHSYLDVLYESLVGHSIMFLSLCLMVLSSHLADRIVNIEV